MLEKINEPIEVIVYFHDGQVRPLRFKWRAQVYDNLKINLIHHNGSVEDKVYYFNVSDVVNSFRLSLSPSNMTWKLEELYTDG